jgi:hypothetical protein
MTIENNDAVKLGASFAGEALIPGASNLLNGDVKQAGLHLVAGLAARSLFGIPGLVLVSANSIVKATTGRHLTEHLGFGGSDTKDATPPTAL